MIYIFQGFKHWLHEFSTVAYFALFVEDIRDNQAALVFSFPHKYSV